jgi:hypothetical protein
MEIGVSKPTFSLFDAKALDTLSTADDCHLSIQIGLNGFSFCIRYKDEILGIESHDFALSQVENTFKSNKWLQKEYASTNTTIVTKKSTLIPSALFKSEDKKKYLEINHVRTEQLEVLADEITQIDSYSVYGISKAEQELITTFFPKSSLKHFSAAHIPNVLAFNKNIEEKKMIVNVSYKQIDICVIEHSKLLYFNIFNHKSPHDCVYYILFVCEQLKLNPEHILLELMGDVKKDSDFYTLLYTYVRKVNFTKRQIKLSPNIDTLAQHEYHPLLHQHQCE